MQDIRIAMGSMGMPVGHLSAKHLRCRTSHFGGLLENSVAVVRNSGRPAARAARPVAGPRRARARLRREPQYGVPSIAARSAAPPWGLLGALGAEPRRPRTAYVTH